jgi:hypothetical protein
LHTTFGDGVSALLYDQDTGSTYTFNGNGASVENFCVSCHDSDGSTLNGIEPFIASGDNNRPADIGWTTGTVSHSTADACFNCHGDSSGINAHGSDYEFLLKYNNYTSGASHSFCYNCHDGTVASTDIQSLFARTYKHGNEDCQACHNQHTAEPGTHTPAGQWYPSSVNAMTNNVSGVLKGVPGVEPSWPSAWTAPSTFTSLGSAAKEYQICFKCHSDFNTGGHVGSSDQALEFNPNNKSAHPVVVTLNSQTGSYSPRALATGQMKSPWTSVGNQTMYCSDCHGANNEDMADPKGPHGSSYQFMLKGPNKLWPMGTNKLFSLNDISGRNQEGGSLNTNWSTTLFCLNCHDSFPSSNKNDWKNKAHQKHDDRNYKPDGSNRRNVYCIACHDVVPHGNKVSRLLAYRSQSSLYNSYSGFNYNVIEGFRKTSRTNYRADNCRTVANLGCDKHKDKNNTWD